MNLKPYTIIYKAGVFLFLICCGIISKSSISQNTDSLLFLYQNKSNDDTTKLNLAIKLANSYGNKNSDSTLLFSLQGLYLAKATSNKLKEELLLLGITNYYNDKANYQKALQYALLALQLNEQTKNLHQKSGIYTLLGSIYYSTSNFDKSSFYFEKALVISRETKNPNAIVTALNNLASDFISRNKLAEAEVFLLEALHLDELRNNTRYFSYYYGNLAFIHQEKLDNDTALMYLFKALFYAKKKFNNVEITSAYAQFSDFYNATGNIALALQYADSSYQLAKNANDVSRILESYSLLSEIYSKAEDYKKAYEYHIKYSALHDSIFSIEKQTKIANLINSTEIEQKELELNTKAKSESEKQQLITWVVFIILVLVTVFSFLLFKRFKIINTQKGIIEKQKHVVEEKQKEIIDSITYAKRLQNAMLPSLPQFKTVLPHSFVYYQPKDIVAGDFYWMHHVKYNKGLVNETECVFIAAADSTGHGVPGALVSIVCSNALNKAVKEFALIEPGKILDKTRELVIETFEKNEENIKDGMDISLLCINKTNKTILWSGANNPLWYIVNNTLTEIKPDKQPIGHSDNLKPFTTHNIPYAEGTVFYLITDGYADQFGGTKGKKFKGASLQKLLIEIHQNELNHQKDLIETTFKNWKGNLEQVDDVTIIGIRV